ncbi:MAG: hypothetical protein [Olavius algarvensis Delta 4 endosymbiont]|nr:MAG: hypothetical protein [Olavius algarvensis Delta 4 endosymbiont]
MDDWQCLLVILGATEDGRKELVALANPGRPHKYLANAGLNLALREVPVADNPLMTVFILYMVHFCHILHRIPQNGYI